jgi:hypothetical protein
MKRLFAPLSKMEEQDDGTIKVWGYASTGAVDDDGETIQPDAIKAALPDYLKWGAVREMHQPKAVGTAIEANVQDDGKTWFGAHIVDPIAVKKVKNKVLKGFSVGGKVTGRDDVEKTTITAINLIEVSLVDRPANPECEIVIAKAAQANEVYVEEVAEILTTKQIDVRALLKAATALAAPPAAAQRSEPLAKGLYNVRDFAQALESLAWICMSAQWDFDSEGDGSAVPADLRSWLKTGVGIFQAMAEEESRELVEMLQEQAGEEIERAAQIEKDDDMKLNLQKAGAKFSKDTKDKLSAHRDHLDKLHKSLKECCDMAKSAKDGIDEMTAEQDDNDSAKEGQKAASALDTKAAAAATADGNVDAMSQLAELIKGAISAAISPLQAELEAIKAKPAGGVPFVNAQAALVAKGHSVVDREADLGGQEADPQIEPVRLPGGKIDEGATITKALLQPQRAMFSR